MVWLHHKEIFQKDTSKLQLMSGSKEEKNLLLCWNDVYIQLFSNLVTLGKYKNVSNMISALPQTFVCRYELWEYKNQFLEHMCSKVCYLVAKLCLIVILCSTNIRFCIITLHTQIIFSVEYKVDL